MVKTSDSLLRSLFTIFTQKQLAVEGGEEEIQLRGNLKPMDPPGHKSNNPTDLTTDPTVENQTLRLQEPDSFRLDHGF